MNGITCSFLFTYIKLSFIIAIVYRLDSIRSFSGFFLLASAVASLEVPKNKTIAERDGRQNQPRSTNEEYLIDFYDSEYEIDVKKQIHRTVKCQNNLGVSAIFSKLIHWPYATVLANFDDILSLNPECVFRVSCLNPFNSSPVIARWMPSGSKESTTRNILLLNTTGTHHRW